MIYVVINLRIFPSKLMTNFDFDLHVATYGKTCSMNEIILILSSKIYDMLQNKMVEKLCNES